MADKARAVLADGLLAGFIGYLVIVIVITLGDLAQGRPGFHTAGLLGAVLFYDLSDPATVVSPWPGPVLAYNGLHMVLMLGFGILLAWLVSVAERGPDFWYISGITLVFVLLHALGLPLLLPDAVTAGVSPWVMTFATTLAMVAMGAFLWRTHPLLRSSLRAQPD